MPNFAGGAWSGRNGSNADDAVASAALAWVPEKLAPATLRNLKRIQEIFQEHLGCAPGEVSLRDAALVRGAVRLSVASRRLRSRCATSAGLGRKRGQLRRLCLAASRMGSALMGGE